MERINKARFLSEKGSIIGHLSSQHIWKLYLELRFKWIEYY